MRTSLFLLLSILSLFSSLSAFAQDRSVVLNYFGASAEGANVKVVWQPNSEQGVSEYRLYRKAGSDTDFHYISTTFASGQNAYNYLDTDVFKNEGVQVTYMLRVMKNGSANDFQTSFLHSTTSVQRTWGSIKSMFR